MNPFKLTATILGALIVNYALCDIIPDNSHPVDKCVKITNISAYENLTLLGYVMYVGAEHEETYIISSEECLHKGYKFNTLDIFAVNSEYIADIAEVDLDGLDLPNDNHALPSNIDLEPWGGYLHDSIPIDRIEEYYQVMGFTETSVVLFKWKEVFGFNDGKADSVQTYEYSGDPSSLIQHIEEVPATLPGDHKVVLNINCYPNPANESVMVEITNVYNGPVRITLLSAEGKSLFTTARTKDARSLYTVIPLAKFPGGTYFIRTELAGFSQTEQISIQ